MTKPAWVTFDCYGTLVDWETGIRAYFQGLLDKKGLQGDPDEILKTWEPIQFQMIQRPYQTYRTILFQSLYETFLKLRIPWKPSDSIGFGDAMATWGPFADTARGLRALRRHAKTAIISNTDENIIDKTLVLIGVPFDLVVTAESVGEYKPSTRNFESALERMKARRGECLHAAFGWDYDIGPARETGFRTCFVNRDGRKRTGPVDLEVKDIPELAERVGGM